MQGGYYRLLPGGRRFKWPHWHVSRIFWSLDRAQVPEAMGFFSSLICPTGKIWSCRKVIAYIYSNKIHNSVTVFCTCTVSQQYAYITPAAAPGKTHSVQCCVLKLLSKAFYCPEVLHLNPDTFLNKPIQESFAVYNCRVARPGRINVYQLIGRLDCFYKSELQPTSHKFNSIYDGTATLFSLFVILNRALMFINA